MARIRGLHVGVWLIGCALVPAVAAAQVATGTITGTVRDQSGAVLPGVNATVAGEYLIGGSQVQRTDAAGIYRFDNLPPGTYTVRFELAGFKITERKGIRINAAFTATVDTALEVGQHQEVVTVEGDSPTVDTRSNLQQTVMSQEILEGVPTGRDPWSVAKIIPGVLVDTYDVGGHQSMQQSAMSAHGSLDVDKTFAVDGLAVNWPGLGGGSTMLYYDQGMFGEVNYQTAAIPAEVQAGGIFMNMVTKDAGNRWRGDFRAYYANEDTQGDNSQTRGAAAPRLHRRQPHRADLRPQPLHRRGHREGPAVVQRRLPRLGCRPPDAGRAQPRRQPGPRRQPHLQLLGQAGLEDLGRAAPPGLLQPRLQGPVPPARPAAELRGGPGLAAPGQPRGLRAAQVHLRPEPRSSSRRGSAGCSG